MKSQYWDLKLKFENKIATPRYKTKMITIIAFTSWNIKVTIMRKECTLWNIKSQIWDINSHVCTVWKN